MQGKKLDYIFLGPAKPFRGGIAETQNYLAEEISLKGFNVEIWTFTKLYPKILFPGKSQLDKNKIEKSKLKSKRLIHAYNFFKWKSVAKKINFIQPKIVVFRYWTPLICPCWYYIKSKLDKSIKTVGLIDNWEHHEPQIWDKKLNTYFGNSMDMIVTFSKAVGMQINRTIKSRILMGFHPIPSGKKFKPSEPKQYNKNESDFVLFFGLIRKYKGLDLAIRAMSNKLIVEKNIKLIIAGEFYDSEERYQDLIRDLSLNNIIIYNQFIANKQVPDFFSVSNLVILPYTSATQSGVTQLAMYYNKPMLVTNVGGLPEIIDHKKDGYISSIIPEEMSEYILDYFSQDNKEKEMSSAISKKHDSYSWDNFVKKIIK